ncbi:MAG: alpha/beta fold hydrolase [Chloroflexi bacterium]|nr:alpha/beta fold hydrolase [Chloroflexota bacterium]
MLRQVVVEDHDMAPDASFAIVVRRSVHGTTYRSHLWLVPLGPARTGARDLSRRGAPAGRGIRPGRLTSGAVRDTAPRISPDGRRVAFIRSWPDDPDRPAAALVLELADGDVAGTDGAGSVADRDPWTVAAPPHGVSDLAWAPDGRRLAFVAPGPERRFAAGRVVPGKPPVVRRIDRLDWRLNDVGYLDRWDHLWVAAARRDARPRRLTRGDWGVASPAWSPDGREIAFLADMAPDADRRPRRIVHAVPVAGGGTRVLADLAGGATAASWSPDGRLVACIGYGVPEPLDDVMPGLFVGPSDGSRPPVALAPHLDLPVGAWQDTDLNGWTSSARPGPAWDGPGQVVALVTDRGRCVPWSFPVDPESGEPAGDAEPLTRDEGARPATADAAGWTLSVSAGTVSVVTTLGDAPQDLMTIEASGRLRRRGTLGSAWRRGLLVPEMRGLDAPGPGGAIECWLASPPGAGDAALPTIVDFHGGPLGAWAPAPALEVHMLVARGYRVLLPNIRGSTSYGAAWIRPQLGDWGGVDAADAHAAVNHVVALGLADPARLGILGLSYGGFMVNWLAATSDRFRAAVTDGGVANQVSSWANSDTGPEYCRAALLGHPFTPEAVDRLWRQSPLAHVTDLRTPLLILQGEADHRCPPADAEQLFVALRVLGRTVEYVLYPDESHTFHITGRPDRRVDRMRRMLDWFERHVLGADTHLHRLPSRPRPG